MNTKRIVPAFAAVSLLVLTVLATGCVGYGYGAGGGIEVGFGPPGFRADVRVATPGPEYVWVPGYYDWVGGNYAWIEGRWVLPPHARAVWVAPRYERHRGHYYYHRGHWR